MLIKIYKISFILILISTISFSQEVFVCESYSEDGNPIGVMKKFEIQPYVADEVFYDLDKDILNRNRLYGGFGFKIADNLKGEIFYLWEATKSSGKYSDTNVLGTKVKFYF